MLLTRLARFQLAIFGVVTVICLALITTSYLHLPAAVGLGVYNVDAKFVVGGGIYQNANVTYRGVTVGRVTNVGLTDNGVTARMRLNTDTPVPDNVTATVKSVSAIGEQYIDLVPPANVSKNILKNGATKQVRTSKNFHLTEDGWDILREADRFEQAAERVQVGGTALHPIYADAQPTKATKAEDGRTATPAQIDRAHAILTAMNPTDMFDLLDTFTVPSKQDLAHMTRAEISDLIKEAKDI